MKVYQEIVGKLLAIENCKRSSNWEWKEKHEEALEKLMDRAPHGSGIDNGIKLLISDCGREKLVFECDFHHMDENGYYDGWSEHKAIVQPSLFHEITIRLTGRNRNDIKEYLGELLHSWLTAEEEG